MTDAWFRSPGADEREGLLRYLAQQRYVLRESIDGATAFPLMAAAEGWLATAWLEPWEPSASSA